MKTHERPQSVRRGLGERARHALADPPYRPTSAKPIYRLIGIRHCDINCCGHELPTEDGYLILDGYEMHPKNATPASAPAAEDAALISALRNECEQMYRPTEPDHVRVPVQLGVLRRALTRLHPQEPEPQFPAVTQCEKCGDEGVAFICSEPGCPVNGGNAYEQEPEPARADPDAEVREEIVCRWICAEREIPSDYIDYKGKRQWEEHREEARALLQRLSAPPPKAEPPQKLHWNQRQFTRCQADDDDHCEWRDCPQLRDGEPKQSGRHCPLDVTKTEQVGRKPAAGEWQTVLTEPTQTMKEAGEIGWCNRPNRALPERAGDCYRAMLAVAPHPAPDEAQVEAVAAWSLTKQVRRIYDRFVADERQGYRSRDRQYAIELLAPFFDGRVTDSDCQIRTVLQEAAEVLAVVIEGYHIDVDITRDLLARIADALHPQEAPPAARSGGAALSTLSFDVHLAKPAPPPDVVAALRED